MFRDLPRHGAYRASGIGWAPELPNHWATGRGKALFERLQREPAESDGVVTCFRDGVVTLRSRRRMTGFTESLKEIGYQGIRNGDLVIHAMDAFAGAAGVSDSDGKGTPVYSVCAPRRDADVHYYAAVVREMARSSWIQALSKGVRERSTDFRFEMFGMQVLPVPPPDEQVAIVKYLAHANARIDKAIIAKRRLIALLEEQRRVQADVAISELPADTAEPLLGRALHRLEQGMSPTAAEGDLAEDQWAVLALSAVNRGTFVANAFKPVSPDLPVPAGLELRDGDLLMTRSNTRDRVGDVAVVRDVRPKTFMSDLIYRLVLREDRLLPDYASVLLRTRRLRSQIESSARGSSDTMPKLAQGHIKGLRISLPALDVQRRVVDELARLTTPISVAAERSGREIALLQEFRTRLVADVVTGQVDIRSIAATLPNAPEAVADLAADSDDELDEVAEDGDE